MEEYFAGNLYSQPVHVKHSDLVRFDDESMYRSICPVCGDGVLLVGRDVTTFGLLAEDRCLLCGQAVIYDDIERMRMKEGR